MKVQCPTCQKDVEWIASNVDRPFCSARCRLIDLGEWASGNHAIPGPSLDEALMSEQHPELDQTPPTHH